jgi:hypothetical protein
VNENDSTKNADLPSELVQTSEMIQAFNVQFQQAIDALQNATARVQRKRARRPKPPAPIAGMLHGFAREVAAKVNAIAALLSPEERERLRAAAPGFVRGVLANDPDVVRLVQVVLGGSPGAAAFCISYYLPILEQRFAS